MRIIAIIGNTVLDMETMIITAQACVTTEIIVLIHTRLCLPKQEMALQTVEEFKIMMILVQLVSKALLQGLEALHIVRVLKLGVQ